MCVCKINSSIFVTTENQQQQLPLSTCRISYTGLSPRVGSRCSLCCWQHHTAVTMAQGVSHLCKGIPTVAHNCPAVPTLPTVTAASLNIVRRNYGGEKITTVIHERRNWNPKEWHLRHISLSGDSITLSLTMPSAGFLWTGCKRLPSTSRG